MSVPGTGGARGILFERALSFLLSRSGDGFCTGCLAKAVNADTSKQMHGAVLKIEARPGFGRLFAICVVCKKNRMVARAIGGQPSDGRPQRRA